MANSETISGLRQELWRKALFADAKLELYMNRFIGPDETDIIQELTDLSAKKGSNMSFGLGMKLSGDGVVGDAELEGQEEAMVDYDEDVAIDQLRHGVRLKGRMDEKKSAYEMRSSAKNRLKIWWAEREDKEILWKLCGRTDKTFANTPTAPAATRIVYANDAGATASLTADEVFDTKCIDAAKQMAKLASPKIRPARVNGKNHYVIILHPYQATDLRKDSVWTQAQREANVRGEKNPIFSGALGIYNDCIIHEHEDIYAWAGGAASIPVCRAVLLGQQAGVIAFGAPVNWVEKSFDYGNKWGISVGRIFGVIKPMFNAKDYGVVAIDTAGTTASTA